MGGRVTNDILLGVLLLLSNPNHQVWISNHVVVLTQVFIGYDVVHELLKVHALRVTQAPTQGQRERPKVLDLWLQETDPCHHRGAPDGPLYRVGGDREGGACPRLGILLRGVNSFLDGDKLGIVESEKKNQKNLFIS